MTGLMEEKAKEQCVTGRREEKAEEQRVTGQREEKAEAVEWLAAELQHQESPPVWTAGGALLGAAPWRLPWGGGGRGLSAVPCSSNSSCFSLVMFLSNHQHSI